MSQSSNHYPERLDERGDNEHREPAKRYVPTEADWQEYNEWLDGQLAERAEPTDAEQPVTVAALSAEPPW